MANIDKNQQLLEKDKEQPLKNAELFFIMYKTDEGEADVIENRKLEEVKRCLRNGADINAVDKNYFNNTALHTATENNYSKIVKYLLSLGARTDIRNVDQMNALALAQWLNCNQEIINILDLYSTSATIQLMYISHKLRFWKNFKNYSEMMILEIDSVELSPDFLQQVEFYNAIDTAGNLFFVDVIVSDMHNIDENFITSQLERINKQVIIQCGSVLNTKVYCKDKNNHVKTIDFNSPVESSDEAILTNKLFSEDSFGIDSIVEAVKITSVGTFDGERRSLLKVSFDLEKQFEGLRLIDCAIRYGDVITVSLLSLSNWNLVKRNDLGTTTLIEAAQYGNMEKLAALLNVKFPISKDNITFPPQYCSHKNDLVRTAVKAKNGDVVNFIRRCGARLDVEINSAWDDNLYDVVLVLLKADCVFPTGFDLDEIDDDAACLEDLRKFVADRDELHKAIENGDIESVKHSVKSVEPSKMYLNISNQSALRKALQFHRLDIFVWLKLNVQAEFKDANERQGAGVGVLDSATDAMVPHYVPIDNAHILHLVANSRCRQHYSGFKEHIERIYTKLNSIPQISTVLKVIQFCDQVDIIYDFDRDSIVDVNVASSECDKGFCEYKAGRIYIGAKVNEQKLLGTIAHELTHLAMQTVFDNDCKPYKMDDPTKDLFEQVVREIREQSGSVDNIIGRVFFCYKTVYWPSELIVRVNQMLAKYGSENGLSRLKEQANFLLTFYTDHVEPKFKLLVAESHLIKPRNNIKFLNEFSGVIGCLKKSSIQFNSTDVLKEFLCNKDKHVLVLSSTSTWLSLINVYQNIKETSLSEDSVLIFQFDRYASRRLEINQAVYTEAGKLLVIECPKKLPDTELRTALSGVGHLVRKKEDKKIILIVKANQLDVLQRHLTSALFNVNVEIVYDDEFTLNSLTPGSQQALLKQNVSLQNRTFPLGDLVDKDSYSLVDAPILTRLVNNEKVTIGKQPIASKGYHEDYYLARAFKNQIKVKKDILDDSDCCDIFAISESTEAVVKTLVKEKHLVCPFDAVQADEHTDMRYIVLDSADGAHQLKELWSKFRNRTLHWLEVEVGDFVWQKSHCPQRDFNFLKKNVEIPQFQCYLTTYLEIYHPGNSDGSTLNPIVVDGCAVKKARDSLEIDEHINLLQIDRIVVKVDIFKGNTDIIAVSHTDHSTIMKHVSNGNEVEYYDENGLNNANYIILDSCQADEQFDQLCAKFPSRNIHWLKREISGLLWHQTREAESFKYNYIHCLTTLNKYTSLTKVHDESDFVNNLGDFKIVLIPDPLGMGRTTVLTRMIKLLNDSCPHIWVIRVDLEYYTTALDHLKHSINTDDEALTFLINEFLDSHEESKLETAFEKNLLLHWVKHRDDRVIVMFDGFDKIEEEHQGVVIRVLNALKQTRVKQLWVTSRPFLKNYLEDHLRMRPYNLKPLTETEQFTFLIRYWKHKLGQVDKKRLKRYATHLLKELCRPINDKPQPFNGLPFETVMIAEKFKTDCKNFCISEMPNPVLNEQYDLFMVYFDYFCKVA